MGERWEERATDFSEGLARNRYRVFKERTYDALVSLKQIFHYHFINGQASIPEVQANIVRELEYQSSLELDPRTFDRLRQLWQQRKCCRKVMAGNSNAGSDHGRELDLGP
jgi:adenylate kinase